MRMPAKLAEPPLKLKSVGLKMSTFTCCPPAVVSAAGAEFPKVTAMSNGAPVAPAAFIVIVAPTQSVVIAGLYAVPATPLRWEAMK